MELEKSIILILLGFILLYSLHGISLHLPKRRKYSYLHYGDLDNRIPLKVLIYFWIFILSIILILVIIFRSV
jgi:hypothetical protein